MREHFLWMERYRPTKVEDIILPSELKKTFLQFVKQKNIPNLILVGGPGMGKTTVARAMCEELGCDYILINGSMKGNIDTLRTDILNFASARSLSGEGRKYVILDEADFLSHATQPALRNFMEEYSRNTGFILTANYGSRIIKELPSRTAVINFVIPKVERPQLATKFFSRVLSILDAEGIEYERSAVVEIINMHFPDYRRVLNELQRFSASGIIDANVLASVPSLKTLVELIKAKNFTECRAWINENFDNNSVELYRKFYDESSKYVKPQFIPALVLLIAKYQYQDAFVVDKSINMLAFISELMLEGIFA